MPAVDRFSRKAGYLDERAQPDLVGSLRQHLETKLRDDAIFSHQWNDIGQRANRRHFYERGERALTSFLPAQRLYQLERHTDARQIFVGIPAIVPPRVDHGNRHRQLQIGLVMVGDDQIDRQFARAARRLDAADAAIDGYHQRHAIGMQPVEGFGLQPVAVFQPVGKKVHDVGAEHLERAAKDDRRGDAVAIVVAVNGDALVPLNRGEDPLHRRSHIRKQPRVVQMIQRRMQELLRALRLVDPADRQQPRDSGADAQLPRQEARGLVVAREAFPEERNRHLFMSHRKDAEAQGIDRDFLNNTTSLIIEKAIVVHSKLGPGLLETIYHTCLAYELRAAGQTVVEEQIVPVLYDGLQLDQGYRLDMLVNDSVIVEIKTVERLLPVHHAQLLSYLKLMDKRVGLLLNFKVPYLVQGIRRIVNNF